MADILTTLYQRFPASDSRVSDLASMLNTVNSFVPIVSKWKEEAASDKNLSQSGASSAYRKKIGENVMREVRKMNAMISESKEKIEASRARITQPTFDANDTLGAAHRREIREFIRSMDAPQRMPLLVSEKTDPIFVNAALELPSIVSGLPEEHAAMVRKVYAERHHGDVLEHIEVREEALEVMTAFSKVFKEEVKKQAGIDSPDQFEAWFDTGAEPEAA